MRVSGGAILFWLTVRTPWMHRSECHRRGLESQMQIVAIGLRSLVETIGSDGKKEVKLPKQPYADCENVI